MTELNVSKRCEKIALRHQTQANVLHMLARAACEHRDWLMERDPERGLLFAQMIGLADRDPDFLEVGYAFMFYAQGVSP